MTKSALLFVLPLLIATGCDNDPGKGKAKAAASAPVAAPAAAPAGAVKHSFSAADSTLEFIGAKVTGSHDGSFKEFTGSVDLVEGDLTKSSVNVEIKMASLAIEPEKLAGHLKNSDFFDVEKFPTAKFVSTSVKAGGDKGASHTVTGNLTMRGTEKSISFPATIKVEGDTVSVNAEFAINRKDFGIVYPGKPDDLIKDEVAIKLTIAAKKSG
ncbi:MAG TPA: YceI family protein [Polyangiaceae bacterium]|nr:YceI family protein [Polyangiaceae bacterium]HMR73836.1 YceI family protein [Polyangiaceae bacterium]